MKTRNQKGDTKLGVLVFILLIASVTLNVILINGGGFLGIGGKAKGAVANTGTPPPPPSAESSYLCDLASSLNIEASSDKTPGDMVYEIKRRLDNRLSYHGDVLTPQALEGVSSSIVVPKDEATFKAYHEFISKISGKTIIVLE